MTNALRQLLPYAVGLVASCGPGPDDASVARAASRAPSDPRAERLRIAQDPSIVRVLDRDRPVLEYRHAGFRFKPYVVRLFTPAGVQVLGDAPADHTHHHGLMLALGIDGVDFWGEVNVEKPGVQRGGPVSHAVTRTGDGGARAVLAQAIDWIDGADERPLAAERREVEVIATGDPGPTLVSWRTSLALAGPHRTAELWGRHYFGLGMRFVAAMDRTGSFVNSSGEPGEVVRGDERLVRARWCAYAAGVDGAPVTVAMFDHPDNPRHPASWFTMAEPFAYLSATLGLGEDPMALDGERPLRLRYGVALWDGAASAEIIQTTYEEWLERERAGRNR